MDVAAHKVSGKYPRKSDKFIQYGTAGFRTKADDLPHVICRIGLLAVIRSKLKQASIGVMITASHNPEEDNGVKLVDPLGEMLEIKWEKYATTLANASDANLSETLSGIVSEEAINMDNEASVLFARDTRPSSVGLAEALQFGITALAGAFTDFGLLTTPQLHYMVRCKNTQGGYGECSVEGYYNKLAAAFIKLNKAVTDTGNYSSEVTVDASNGVGGGTVRTLAKHLGETLTVNVAYDGSGKLNYKCGADHVKVNQCAPEGMEMVEGMKYVSYDGDADRIVYYYKGADGKFNLMDGDRLATLIAGYLMNLVQSTGLQLKLGLVQTAYANGGSTIYITQTLKVPVACVATGVKYLQKKAEEFDIGVYFEANGHGTVLFSNSAEVTVKQAASDTSLSGEQRSAADKLLTVIDLINQTVGDAMSDMLLVEMILCSNGWDMARWRDCYTDLANRQLKVKVADRNVIKTTPDETQTTSPAALQPAIDAAVARHAGHSARSFARPSGTEDIVRVYAEADTQAVADALGYEVCQLVFDHAGGTGNRPYENCYKPQTGYKPVGTNKA